MPVVVHHLEDSRSQRVLFLLEHLKVDYTVKQYKRLNGVAPPELLKIFPLGKSPVITDGALTIAESGAIMEYIVRKYDTSNSLKPQTEQEQLDYDYFMHFAEGTIIPTLVLKQVFQVGAGQVPFLIRPIFNAVGKGLDEKYMTPECAKNFGFVEQHLQTHEWFSGPRLTTADFQMSFPMEIADRGGCTPKTHPNIFAWRKKVGQMESYKAALAKGGMKYDYALTS